MENHHCPICQSNLRKKFWDTETSVGVLIKYNCALYGDEHYAQYLNDDESSINEEFLKIQSKGKTYHIYQYHEDKYIVVSVFSPDGYEGQFHRNFEKLPFDLLKDDVDKIIQKIQVILTFQ